MTKKKSRIGDSIKTFESDRRRTADAVRFEIVFSDLLGFRF